MAGQLTHLGFIADGNRRWAKEHHLPTLVGHTRGFDRIDPIIDFYKNIDEVKYLSFFLFSTENWDRSEQEIKYLMELADHRIQGLTEKCNKENMRILIMGRPEPVDPGLWQKMLQAEETTKDNTGMNICICFNYGGLWEIADAATKAANAGERNFTPEIFAKYLYHPEVPPLDLIVRTSGEQRISGFQLWRAAYSEFIFLNKFFPAIDETDCQEILDEYRRRSRRFGK